MDGGRVDAEQLRALVEWRRDRPAQVEIARFRVRMALAIERLFDRT